MRIRRLAMPFVILTPAIPAAAQAPEPVRVTTVSYGTLNQNDLALRLRNDDLEIRFIPLDPKITRLLANDAFQSLRSVVETRRRAIDSVASRAGVTEPGLALVSFFGAREATRFDPQTLTVRVRNRVLQPLGLIPIDARFTSQQLNLREQASAIYLFEEDLPVDDSFSLSYGALTSDDWQAKQSLIDRERARVSARARAQPRDTSR
ncbi:MAG TPA: hypothetical protein VFO71_04185 [Gemmatimonadales bacterium]|nr:hypothetical protein [Gemmatimonadales bacterium]